MGDKESWGFEEGEAIVPGRLALQRLGGGIEYEVYLAWDERLYSLVVAKVIRPDRIEDEDVLRHFRRETEMLSRLVHPVIVRAFGVVPAGPRPHLVLEHLEGPTLHSLIRKYGTLALEQLLPLALQVCAALHYLSAEGVVHLDVKPGNIVMGAPPRLLDLSIARTFEDAAGLTGEVGTDDYMAPEQCRPGELGPVGPKADVWGLGVTLYEAITGHLPWVDEAEGTEYPQLDADPVPLPGEIPGQVSETVLLCLQRDPGQRPTAAEVAISLEPVVAALPRRPVLGLRRGFR